MPPQKVRKSTSRSKRTRVKKRRRSRERFSNTTFLKSVDLGLMGAICVVPFIMGGRIPLGHFALAFCSSWAAICWVLHRWQNPHQNWIWSRLEPVFLLGILLVLIQTIALPDSLLNVVSPKLSELLPLWSNAGSEAINLGSWQTLSLNPAATKSNLVPILSCMLLFTILLQRIRSRSDAATVLKWCCSAAGLMAGFGLLQFFLTNGKYFWFYEYPGPRPDLHLVGAFTNRNHFSHFLVLSVGPMLAWCLIAHSRLSDESMEQTWGTSSAILNPKALCYLLYVSLGLILTGIVLSLSRGAIISTGISSVVCLTLLYRRKEITGKILGMLIGIGILIGTILSIHGFEDLTDRVENDEIESRAVIWETNLTLTSQFPWIGTGLGTHIDSHLIVHDDPFSEQIYTHAESSPLQVGSEMGVGALLLVAIAMSCWLVWSIRGVRAPQDRTYSLWSIGILGSVCAHSFHIWFDFLWYIPGLMIHVMALAAVACRFRHFQKEEQNPSPSTEANRTFAPPIFHLAGLAGTVCLAGWMLVAKYPEVMFQEHWYSYLRTSYSDDGIVDLGDREGVVRSQIMDLTQALQAYPNHARAHSFLSSTLMEYFEIRQFLGDQGMTNFDIRDLLNSSEFESEEQKTTWLANAIEENRLLLDLAIKHAKKAIHLSPIQSNAYLNLVNLNFLEDNSQKTRDDYLAQSLKVRPHNAYALYTKGLECWFLGDTDNTFKYWKESFQRSRANQQQIIRILVNYYSPGVILKEFEPDLEALSYLKDQITGYPLDDDVIEVFTRFAEAALEETKEAGAWEVERLWAEASSAYEEIGDMEKSLACLQEGMERFPDSFELKYGMSKWYLRQEQFDEAIELLKWCTRRHPEDGRPYVLLKEALQISGQRLTAEEEMHQKTLQMHYGDPGSRKLPHSSLYEK